MFPLPPVFICWSHMESMEGTGKAGKTWASEAVLPSFARFYFPCIARNGSLSTCSSLRPLLSCDFSKMHFSSNSALASASPKRNSVMLTRWKWGGFCIYFSVIQSNQDRFDKPTEQYYFFNSVPFTSATHALILCAADRGILLTYPQILATPACHSLAASYFINSNYYVLTVAHGILGEIWLPEASLILSCISFPLLPLPQSLSCLTVLWTHLSSPSSGPLHLGVPSASLDTCSMSPSWRAISRLFYWQLSP